MLYELINEYKKIKIGDNVKVKGSCLPPGKRGFVIVPKAFQDYINKFDNSFTVRTIQKIDKDNVMVAVFEVGGVLEYPQVEPFSYKGTVKIVNC
jgi:hypothetical protein